MAGKKRKSLPRRKRADPRVHVARAVEEVQAALAALDGVEADLGAEAEEIRFSRHGRDAEAEAFERRHGDALAGARDGLRGALSALDEARAGLDEAIGRGPFSRGASD